MGMNHACAQCGAGLKPGARFCAECGHSAAGPEVPPGPGSFVNGVWDKGEDELVRQVSERDLVGRYFDSGSGGQDRGFWAFLRSAGSAAIDAMQGRAMQIPTGCVAAVVIDGRVAEVLPPGLQVTVRGLWQIATGGGTVGEAVGDRRSQFYLIDRRPVPVHLQVEVPGAQPQQSLTLGISVTATLAGTNGPDPDRLASFLSFIVRDRDVLTAGQLRDQIRPHVERTARDIARTFRPGSTDYDAITRSIKETLDNAIGKQGGLGFDVVVSPRAAVVSLNLHLGQVQLPELTPCVRTACDGQVRFGATYCPECGQRQPARSYPDRACQGVSTQSLPCEASLAVGQRFCRACGTENHATDMATQCTGYRESTVPCGAQVPVGGQFCRECGTPYTETSPEAGRVISKDGELVELDLVLRAQGNRELDDPTPVERAIADAVSRLVRSMSYDELSTAEGFRRVGEALEGVAEQTLRAMQLTLLDITVLDCKSKNGEWLMGARAELKRASLEQDLASEWLDVDAAQITLDGERVKLDLQKLDVEQMRMDVRLRQMRMRMDEDFQQDVIELKDREARQALLDKESELDIADAQRDSRRDVAIDEAARDRDRTLRERDHEDVLAEADRADALEDRADDRRRSRESSELGHQLDLENRSAEHDDAQARRAMQLDSDRSRQVLDDQIYAQRQQDTAELDRQERSQDLDIRGERARMEIDQDSLDRDHGRQKDLVQMEQDSEAREREWQLQVLKQKAEAEAARIKAEQERQTSVNQSLAGMSEAQIAAAAMHGRALSDAEAAAMGSSMGAADAARAELLERMMAERMSDKDQNQAQMMAMFQQMMQMNMTNTASLAGAQQQSQQQAHEQVVAAHRAAQGQAQSMAERSMDAMSTVAASRATPQVVQAGYAAPVAPPPVPRSAAPEQSVEPEQKVAPPAAPRCVAPSCGIELAPGTKFCDACGTRQVD